MRFKASDAYGQSFNSEGFRFGGMPDELRSSSGFDAFVKNPLELREGEFRLAGDSLINYVNTLNAKETAEAQMELAQRRGSGGGSGGSSTGRTIGEIAGTAAGLFIPGAQPFTGALAKAGGGVGDLIGGFFG